jgi:hypothetical protein
MQCQITLGLETARGKKPETSHGLDRKKKWVEKKPWQDQPKYTMESAMEQPCRWHTPNPTKPVNHLKKYCSWTKYLMARGVVKDARNQGSDALLPPPPLTRANAQPIFAQQNKPHQQEAVHQVVQGNNNQAPPPCR